MRHRLIFGSCRQIIRTHLYKVSSVRFSNQQQPIQSAQTFGACQFEELQGRPWKLFLSPENTALAHCVSNDFQMDNGIAKQFLKKYGNFEELLEQGMVFPHGQKVGSFGVLKTEERFIYYLISRERWWDPGSYGAVEQSLRAMRAHCADHGVSRLAVPRIGAQQDRLDWHRVRQTILDVFQNSDIAITAYSHR